MKWRYLKITGPQMIWGTNVITVADLARLKNGQYEAILDLERGTYFDPENNEWVDIAGNK